MEVFFKNKDIKLVPGAKSQRDVFQSGRVSGKQIDPDCENWNGLGKGSRADEIRAEIGRRTRSGKLIRYEVDERRNSSKDWLQIQVAQSDSP